VLQRAILQMARSSDATELPTSPYGQKYEVRADVVGPSGREAEVVTIWIVLAHEEIPRLVTAYPGDEH
jgi:hypothetical protein